MYSITSDEQRRNESRPMSRQVVMDLANLRAKLGEALAYVGRYELTLNPSIAGSAEAVLREAMTDCKAFTSSSVAKSSSGLMAIITWYQKAAEDCCNLVIGDIGTVRALSGLETCRQRLNVARDKLGSKLKDYVQEADAAEQVLLAPGHSDRTSIWIGLGLTAACLVALSLWLYRDVIGPVDKALVAAEELVTRYDRSRSGITGQPLHVLNARLQRLAVVIDTVVSGYEQHLRDRDAQMQFLHTHMPVPLALTNSLGMITQVNAALLELSGFAIGDIFGKSISDLVPELVFSDDTQSGKLAQQGTLLPGTLVNEAGTRLPVQFCYGSYVSGERRFWQVLIMA